MKNIMIMAFAGLILIGCANPIEHLQTTDGRPSIVLQGAPSNAGVYIDGKYIGRASDYTSKAIIIENGTHTVTVTENGNDLLSQKIFVSGSGTKTLTVPTGK